MADRYIDLAKLGTVLHALCPRSRHVGDACDGTSRVADDGLSRDCKTCKIAGTLLLPYAQEAEA